MTDTRDPNPEQFPERLWLLRTIPADPDDAGEVYSRWLDAPLENTRRYECQEYRPVRTVAAKQTFDMYWQCTGCWASVRQRSPRCPDCGALLDWSKVER